jgi:NodT family efflux transporter outer membrane factor (OMF) lipoprotein
MDDPFRAAGRWIRPSSGRALGVGTAWLLSLALSGCITVGPDYAPPEPDVPDRWHQELAEGFVEGETNLHSWWRTLDDPVLDGLIERAAAGNLDLQGAFARIQEARALRGIATGERFPDVNASGSAVRNRLSEGTNEFVPPGRSRTDNTYAVGLDANWEIDLWGRIRRSVEAADAGVDAAFEDYRDVLVLLYAEVALTYIDIRSLQARIRYAEDNRELQADTVRLTRARFDAGISPELDVRQAELNLATTSASIPVLEAGLARSMHRLAVLLGEHPGALHDDLVDPRPIPDPPVEVAVGIPADLARQRPDIRRAERELASQTALVGVATADLYPRFSLTGTFGFEAYSSLFRAGNQAWSLGIPLFWNLFDGGRVRNRIRAEDARTQQALVAYERTVLLALEEVENSMVSYLRERVRRQELAKAVEAARKSVELVKTLYTTGLTDFQNVLDSERSLAVRQDELAASEGEVVRNLVSLYRALGGGWQPDPEVLRQEIEDAGGGEPRI